MGGTGGILEQARDAYGRREWAQARDRFLAAAHDGELGADDLFLLGDAAWWLGAVDESIQAGAQAYRAYLDDGRPADAAMSAIGVAVNCFLRGDDVVGSGWVSRAARLLDQLPEGRVHGYARYMTQVEGGLDGPDLDAVVASARDVQAIGRRHGDPNLVAAGTVGEGRALLRLGRVREGMALLDEAMVAVMGDELTPDWAGNVYCHLMSACFELADVHRAASWTEATTRWLRTLPAAAVFSGICRVHRSQLLQIRGAWPQAEREAERVCADLAGIHLASAAEGYYQIGELRRLRGDLAGAADAYEQAHQRGRDPQPGIALLRLAQGEVEAAATSIRAALQGETRPLARFWLRAAQVEIALAGGDVDAAREAGRELDDITRVYDSPGFRAARSRAQGAVLLAEGRPEQALAPLLDSSRRWHQLDAPYDVAQTRCLLADAYGALGDTASAARERAAAHDVFARLGAAAGRARDLPAALTEREAQVLAQVAAGASNRDVARALVISEKTVARHLSNIFTKLGVSSRTQAAAFAFEHGLARRPHG